MHTPLTITVALAACGWLTVDGASMTTVGSPEGSLAASTSASGSDSGADE